MLTQEILDSALQLPEADRLLVASRLLATLPDEVTADGMDEEEFTAELERRSGDWLGAVSWDDLKASMPSDQ